MGRASLLVAAVALGGCVHGPKILEAGACAAGSDSLSVAFTDPDKARRWLARLAERLKEGDPTATEDAAALIADLQRCIPEA